MIHFGSQNALEQIHCLLEQSPFASLRDLKISLTDDTVRLCGSVGSFYLKQIAQETIRNSTRGFQIVNDIHVAADLDALDSVATNRDGQESSKEGRFVTTHYDEFVG